MRGKIIQRLLLGMVSLMSGKSLLAQTPPAAPAPYTSNARVNCIRIWDAAKPEIGPDNITVASPIHEFKMTTQYFDGLGRPLQTVVKQGSLNTSTGAKADMISPVVYDEFGREQFKYLPFASTATDVTKDNGLFKSNPFQQQVAFYNTQLNGQTGETNVGTNSLNWAYGQTFFEPSPLNRVTETFASGSSWVGTATNATESNRKSVKTKYYINTDLDGVRIWKVNNGVLPAFSTYSIPASPEPVVYAAGQLYKTITVDEHNKQVVEFKDKEGKVILKKVQLTAAADNGSGSDHPGWLCTYYIYDDLNNLRCVIQPRGVELLRLANWAAATLTAILPEQCFRYEYDGRNRMVMKKVPGANEVFMVYDARDRLVMTQHAKLRAINKWMVTLYDELNRPVQSGLLFNTYTTPAAAKTFVQHLADAASSIAYPFAVATPPTTTYWEYLTKTGYDGYATIPTASGLTSSMDPAYRTDNAYGINTNYNTAPDYAQEIPVTASTQTKGMVTWTETKVLNTTTYLYTVNLYDDKGRLVQVKSKNITGGADLLTTQYSWAGQPLVIIQKQVKAGTLSQTSVIITKMSYDNLGRLIQTDKKIRNTNVSGNALPANYTTVSKMEYDALGQLKIKKLGNKPGAPGMPLAVAGHEYNVRGWLLSINKGYMNNANADQYFGMELGYDKNASFGTFSAQYNGNISGALWKSEGDQQKRKYNFSYDPVNRLTKADFTQYVSGTGSTALFNTSAGIDFSMGGDPTTGGTMKYDANGNITEMWQTGLKINTSSVIDKLAYTYNTNSNKLLKVFDAVTPITDNGKLGDFKDGSNGTGNDYIYDVNGNLTQDLNKTISSITYNHLNQPLIITVTGKGTITYTYDAAGNKQKKVTVETASAANNNITTTTTTTYLGGVVYESKTDNNAQTTDYTDRLQFIGHEEGRIRFKPENNTLHYDYMLKDHLGNVRMVLTEEQQQDQYPAATMEGTYSAAAPEATSMINYEKKFYAVNNTYVVNSSTMPGWTTAKDYANNNGNPPYNLSYPAGTTPAATATSAKVYKLNATTNKTGLGMVLKVMAGDKIDIHGKSYYQSTTTYNNANSTLLSIADLIGAFIGSPDNAGFIGKGITSPTMQTINTNQIPTTFFRGNDNTSSAVPKAYINYIFFDEQFKYAGGNFSRVGTSGTVKNHWFSDAQLRSISVPKSGYLYVYVTNESNDNVFFDNLQVFHTRGPILEETHYYPFGLTMSGISSKALAFGNPNNKIKFQGQELANKEFSDGSGLEMYEFKWRMHDPQTGRFWQIDPLASDYEYNSTYAFSENHVTGHIELEGLEKLDSNDPRVRALMSSGTQKQMKEFNNNASQAGSVKVSVGPGVGATVQVPGAKVNAGVSGPQASVTTTLGGQTTGEGSAANAGAQVQIGPAKLNAGTSVGNVEIKDGQVKVDPIKSGAGLEIASSKEVKQENTSGTLKGALFDVTFGVGFKIGVVGVEVTANVVKAGKAVVNFFAAIAEYGKGVAKEMMKRPEVPIANQ